MISQEEALQKILAHVEPLPSRELGLADALDRFAADDIVADRALPAFDNSAMDGYAVLASSAVAGARLQVVGEQPAGVNRQLRLAPGEAIRIFTGAPLPAGADAVVMQEDVSAVGTEIILREAVASGEFARRRGGDITEGQRLLAKGEVVTPQAIALLAAQGRARVAVGGEVRAAVISTGDELVPPGVEPAAGQIFDSNSPLLRALLQKAGATIASVRHCRDEQAEIESAVRAGASCDVMIITGGVSVGARDFVKEAIEAAGGALDLWRVAVKPGKPFLFGRVGRCAIFGLPGNPVSAFVAFLLFVRPALRKLMGAGESGWGLASRPARLMGNLQNDGDRPHYIRGVLEAGDLFRPVGRQESHALFGLSRSNALLLLHPREMLAAESAISVFTWE